MKISDVFKKRNGSPRYAVGVQLLGVDIRVAVIENVAGRLLLKRCERFKVTPARTPGEILKAALDGMGVAGAAAVVVMDPARYRLLSIEAPDVEPANQTTALKVKAAELVDYNIDQAEIDFIEIPGRNSSSRSGQYYVAVAEKEYISSLVSLADVGGIALGAIDITELAIRNVVALEPASAAGVLLLDLQSGSPRMYLFKAEQLFLVRPLKVDVKKLVKDLELTSEPSDKSTAEPELSLALDDGQKNDGSGAQKSSVEFDGMILQLTRSLSYFQRNLGQSAISGVLMMEPNFASYLSGSAKQDTSDSAEGNEANDVDTRVQEASDNFSKLLSDAMSLPVSKVLATKLGCSDVESTGKKSNGGSETLAARVKPAKISEMLPAIGAAVRAAT